MLNEVKPCKAGRKVISFMHISLDGFVAALKREMKRIKVDEVPKVRRTPSEDAFGEIFDHVGKRISRGDAALYGRIT